MFDWETLTKAGKRPERKAEKQLRREIGGASSPPPPQNSLTDGSQVVINNFILLVFRGGGGDVELMREAHHPNIVQLLDVVLTHPESSDWSRPRTWPELISLVKSHAHSIHLILEYVPGGDMRDYLRKKGRLSETEARYWLRQLGMTPRCMNSIATFLQQLTFHAPPHSHLLSFSIGHEVHEGQGNTAPRSKGDCSRGSVILELGCT